MESDKISSGTRGMEKIERNHKAIALNILYVKYNAKAISVAYRSEWNNKRKKQVILLMITNGKKYHYLAVTNLSALLEGKSSNHHADSYCLNCFIHTPQKINLKNMKKYATTTIVAS